MKKICLLMCAIACLFSANAMAANISLEPGEVYKLDNGLNITCAKDEIVCENAKSECVKAGHHPLQCKDLSQCSAGQTACIKAGHHPLTCEDLKNFESQAVCIESGHHPLQCKDL